MKLTKSIVVNGERIVVEMSDEEATEFEAKRQKDLEVREAIKAKRQALLDKLGITEEEAAVLLG